MWCGDWLGRDKEIFWSDKNVLYLVLDTGYLGASSGHNLAN